MVKYTLLNLSTYRVVYGLTLTEEFICARQFPFVAFWLVKCKWDNNMKLEKRMLKLKLHFIIKDTLAHVFFCNFVKDLRTPILQNASERLLLNLSFNWNHYSLNYRPKTIFQKLKLVLLWTTHKRNRHSESIKV